MNRHHTHQGPQAVSLEITFEVTVLSHPLVSEVSHGVDARLRRCRHPIRLVLLGRVPCILGFKGLKHRNHRCDHSHWASAVSSKTGKVCRYWFHRAGERPTGAELYRHLKVICGLLEEVHSNDAVVTLDGDVLSNVRAFSLTSDPSGGCSCLLRNSTQHSPLPTGTRLSPLLRNCTWLVPMTV